MIQYKTIQIIGDEKMSKIIQIDTLYDKYHKMNFGYVGIDLETKEIKYYSNYKSIQEYHWDSLYEFDPNNLDTEGPISWHMYHCTYKRPSLSDKLPDELVELAQNFINKHKEYNINNNYPIQNIDENVINLSLQYRSNFSLFGDTGFSAIYIPVENIIGLATDKTKWDRLSDDKRDNFKNSLIHEIGHMKVSSCKLDEANNILSVKTGFYWSEIELKPIMLENGDIFYKITKIPEEWKNCNQKALEEIINDFDCSLAFSSFKGNYPKLGKRLNDLCNQRLTYARYGSGIEELYTSLQRIIDSRDLADELLEYISDSIFGNDTEMSENKALQLIKKYEENK